MALPKFEDIAKQFLYGSNYVPSDLINSNIIRSSSAGSSVMVNKTEFMTTGAGRFAVGAQFELVYKFFAEAISGPLTPGTTYTKEELAGIYGLTFYGWNTQQYYWNDGADDYTERTLIYNTSSFKLSDSVRFVVTSTGERYVTAFSVEPNGNENFDFASNDTVANLLNPYLSAAIDPSNIGRIVNIAFSNETLSTKTYTSTDFYLDNAKIVSWYNPFALPILASQANAEINALWNDGITKFLDSSNRPILYGTHGSDALNAENSGFWEGKIGSYKNNGVVVLGGDGDDALYATGRKSDLYGGNGNDTLVGSYNGVNLLYGEDGNDTLIGGDNEDILYGGTGNDRFDGQGGKDYFVGGTGDDTFVWDYDYHETITIDSEPDASNGTDIIELVGMTHEDIFGKYNSFGGGTLYSPDGVMYLLNFKNKPGPVYFKNPDGSFVSVKSVFDEDEDPEDPNGAPNQFPLLPGGDPASWIPGVLKPDLDDGNEAVGARLDGSPLVIDMDGDGIELTDLDVDPIYWDVDNDDFREASAWVKGDDALLVMDRNNNGTIDNHSELFGTRTIDGFTILSELDSNQDGVIDVNDAQFAELQIWQDLNQDGRSDASELQTLTQAGIKSINLNATQQTGVYIAGNEITHISTVTMDNNSTKTIVDAWFKYDNTNTIYDGAWSIDPRVLYLPTLRGYGSIKDLHIAMSQDEALLEQVTEMANYTLEDVLNGQNDFSHDFQYMIYRWAGTEGNDMGVSGSFMAGGYDLRKTDFLDMLGGTDYRLGVDLTQFTAYYMPGYLRGTWQVAMNELQSRFLAQTVFKDLFTGTLEYSLTTDEVSGATGLSLTGLDDIADLIDLSTDKTAAWTLVARVIEGIIGIDNLTTPERTALENAIDGDSIPHDLDSIYTAITEGLNHKIEGDEYVSNTIHGTGSEDLISGHVMADTLHGGGGDDRLYGLGGDDIYYGGAGDDLMSEEYGNGNDIYHYTSGNDSILETGGTDKVVFESGVTLSDIYITRNQGEGASDMMIHVEGRGSIRVFNEFNSGGYGNAIETLEFADTSTLNLIYIDNPVFGSGTINGADRSYYLRDIIYGNYTNDTINGGLGDDLLRGGSGDDIYLVGEGFDWIRDDYGADQIVFDNTYDPAKFTFVADPNFSYYVQGSTYLDILYDGVQKVRIENFFQSDSYAVETLVINGVDTIDLTTLQFEQIGTSAGENMYGYEGIYKDNFIYAMGGDDTVTAGSGNDTVEGGLGHDTLLGGDGNDILHGNEGNDSLQGGWGTDILYGGAGTDTLNGGGEADIFVFDATAFDAVDTIEDFNTGQNDVIRLADLLTGFTPGTSNINDFVKLTASGSGMTLSVDRDGTGLSDDFEDIALLAYQSGLIVDTLFTNGSLAVL